jgi:hypothetical protein
MTSWQTGRLAVGLALACAATVAYFIHPFSTPPGYFTDALSNVINAVYIHKFGTDEYGVAYPLVGFRSFGDYKPPLYMYIYSLLLYFFPPSLGMARLVSLVAGWFGIAITVALAKRLLSRAIFAWTWAPLGGLFLLSSWVLVTQRIAMEMTLVILTIALLIAATWATLQAPRSLAAGLALGLIWGLMPYVYHSTKCLYFIQPPMVVAALLLSHGRGAWRFDRARGLYLAFVLGGILGLPMLRDLLGERTALARFHTVGSSTSMRSFVHSIFLHLGPGFLFLTGDANPRHHSNFLGMLNLAVLPLLPMGLWAMLRKIREQSGLHLYLLLLFVAGLVPVSLTNQGLPHALRTLNLIPPLLLIAFIGVERWWDMLIKANIRSIGVGLAVALFLAGGLLAAVNVHAYMDDPRAGYAWTYYGPKSFWRENDHLFDIHDHDPSSVAYRYYRIVELKDYRFRD